MRICRKCGSSFSNWAVVDGKRKNVHSRKFCLVCSPWGQHNTKKIDKIFTGKRTCSKCKEEKSISEFCVKNAERTHSQCKICLYETQKDRWTQLKKDATLEFGGKCSKCGYNKNYAALHFHHKDESTKNFSWNRLRLQSKEVRKKELDKCELICSNCHAELHNPECNLTRKSQV